MLLLGLLALQLVAAQQPTTAGSPQWGALGVGTNKYNFNVCDRTIASWTTCTNKPSAQSVQQASNNFCSQLATTATYGWSDLPNGIQLTYSSGGDACGSNTRTFSIQFICNAAQDSPTANVSISEPSTCQYVAVINTPLACAGSPTQLPGTPSQTPLPGGVPIISGPYTDDVFGGPQLCLSLLPISMDVVNDATGAVTMVSTNPTGITLVGTLFADLTLEVGTEGAGAGVDCSGTFLASGYIDLATCALRSNPTITCSCDYYIDTPLPPTPTPGATPSRSRSLQPTTRSNSARPQTRSASRQSRSQTRTRSQSRSISKQSRSRSGTRSRSPTRSRSRSRSISRTRSLSRSRSRSRSSSRTPLAPTPTFTFSRTPSYIDVNGYFRVTSKSGAADALAQLDDAYNVDQNSNIYVFMNPAGGNASHSVLAGTVLRNGSLSVASQSLGPQFVCVGAFSAVTPSSQNISLALTCTYTPSSSSTASSSSSPSSSSVCTATYNCPSCGSEEDEDSQHIIVIVGIVMGALFVMGFAFFAWRQRRNRRHGYDLVEAGESAAVVAPYRSGSGAYSTNVGENILTQSNPRPREHTPFNPYGAETSKSSRKKKSGVSAGSSKKSSKSSSKYSEPDYNGT